MNSNIMETVHGRSDSRMNFENHKVILFLDNATCHPKILQNRLTNIELVFSLKAQHPDYNLLMQVLS